MFCFPPFIALHLPSSPFIIFLPLHPLYFRFFSLCLQEVHGLDVEALLFKLWSTSDDFAGHLAAETVHGLVRNQLRHRKELGSQLSLLGPYEHFNFS